MKPPSRRKAPRVHGCTPIFIAKKATKATPPIGTVGQVKPFAEGR
jgi:hypothetical protein